MVPDLSDAPGVAATEAAGESAVEPALLGELGLPETSPSGDRHVEVAIDAAGGAGNRTYSYAVPPELADLADGEAVLVEFGRRQAIGIVLGPGQPPAGVAAKPIASRVLADGPLLPPRGPGRAPGGL
jgi:hypothetical protein